MNKPGSLKSFGFKRQNDFLKVETSTQLTDHSDSIRSPTAFETPNKIKPNPQDQPTNEKLISRTSSVTLLKQPPRLVQFNLFGSILTLDVSQKEQSSIFLDNWFSSVKICGQTRAQIKLIVYEELFKRNIEFKDQLESSLSEYAQTKLQLIQEEQADARDKFK